MKDQKVKLYEIFAIGLSFGSVLLLRPNMVSVWFVFCLIILLDLFFKKKYSLLAKIVAWFVAGALTVLLPFVIYLNHFGALSDGIFQAFTFNFMYLGDSNSKEQGIVDLLKLISANYILLFLIAIIIANIYKWKELQDNEKKVFIGATCTVFLSFLLSVMSGRAYPHYLMVVIPSIIVPIVWLLNYFSNRIIEKKLVIMSLVFIPFIFMTQIYDAYNYAYEINIITTQNNKDTEKFDLRETKSLNNQRSFQKLTEVANVIKQNSGIKDRIYTHRIGGNLYLLSDRLASIKYFNLPAVNINENNLIGNDFLIDIKNSESKLIVLETTFKDKEKYEIEKEFFDWVSNQYNVIYEKNNYTVYLKK